MPFQFPSFVTNLFKKSTIQGQEEGSDQQDMDMECDDTSSLTEPRVLTGGIQLLDAESSMTPTVASLEGELDSSEPFIIEDGLEEEANLIEFEERTEAELDVLESQAAESNEAFLIREGEEVTETLDEFLGYEEVTVTEENTEPFLPMEVSHEQEIDAETQITETVVDSTSRIYEGGEEDKENGQRTTQSDFIDDVEAESDSIVEITRRRLSHEGICYCGKDRNLNIAELLCASCHRWYHESCIGYQLGKLVPFMMNYIFICKNCSPTGLESFKRSQAPFVQMCVTAIANLQQASVKDGTNRQRFSKDVDIIPFIDIHWEGMTPTRRVSQSWHSSITRTLFKERDLFTIENLKEDPSSPFFGLLALDLTQIRPNYEAMIKSGILKLGDLNTGGLRRGGAKRRTVDGSAIYAQSQAAVAKKTKGDTFLAKSFGVGFGYPIEHPFNKDGYRYILAEPDSNAPFRQEFDESSDWAGKPIPGWLYRVLIPPFVFLALHDRAPQLRVSDDRLSVTGEKGYCMIRASHYVTKGSWFWEAKVTELPEGAACRIGWGQCYANLQAPLGFDKFGYSWRSRLGTKFHQAIGKTYCAGGYSTGDVLGFMIILPDPASHVQKVFGLTDPPSVSESLKDKPLVRFKSHLYYEDKDISAEVEVTDVRPGSKIICFKNGVCLGVAYEDLFEGCYYPSISLYKGCTVKANFGPNFQYPPSHDTFSYKAFQERAEDAIIEQTMSDILFLTENHRKLSLDNTVPILN